jgi:hypothetical protein
MQTGADDSSSPNPARRPASRQRARQPADGSTGQAQGTERPEQAAELSGRSVQQAPGDAQIRGDLTPNTAEPIGEPFESGHGHTEPTEQEIRERAYLMYLERGESHGRDFDDWVAAEQQLRGRRKS